MKAKVICCLVGMVLGFTRVEGAFEEVKPLQSGHIATLVEKAVYDQEEIKGYDLNEIYIAGALLMEGWGCDQGPDEKRALQLYRTALEVVRKDPMDLDTVWSEEALQELYQITSERGVLPIFKAECDQSRKPHVLYAMIADTIRLLLRQGEYEEALQLMEESRRLSLFKGKEIEEVKHEDAKGGEASGTEQVVHFYEFMLNDEIEDGSWLIATLFPPKKKEGYELLLYNAMSRNMLVGELVVRGFEQKPVEEKLKAFPYVFRNARLGVPQAMEAMHLYYKSGCGFLPSNQAKAEEWHKRLEAIKCSYSPSE